VTTTLDLVTISDSGTDRPAADSEDTGVIDAVDAALTAAGFPTSLAGSADVAAQRAAHVRALTAQRDQYREALAVVRLKATTLERQPAWVLQWIGRYCAIASIPPAVGTTSDRPDGEASSSGQPDGGQPDRGVSAGDEREEQQR
jgi:hypothetical protein